MKRGHGGRRALRVSVALSIEECERVEALAGLHGLALSAYIRMRALDDPIERSER